MDKFYIKDNKIYVENEVELIELTLEDLLEETNRLAKKDVMMEKALEYEDWVERSDKWERVMDGSKLIELIVNHLNDHEFMSINAQDNFIHIENFDPMSGETASYNITYEEVDDERV